MSLTAIFVPCAGDMDLPELFLDRISASIHKRYLNPTQFLVAENSPAMKFGEYLSRNFSQYAGFSVEKSLSNTALESHWVRSRVFSSATPALITTSDQLKMFDDDVFTEEDFVHMKIHDLSDADETVVMCTDFPSVISSTMTLIGGIPTEYIKPDNAVFIQFDTEHWADIDKTTLQNFDIV